MLKFYKQHIDRNDILMHILFWMTWIFSFVIIQSLGHGRHEYFVWLMYYLITLPIFVVHTYLIAYWLVPAFFFRRHYLMLTIIGLAFLVIFSVIELVVSNELVFKVFDPKKAFSPGYLNLKNILISGLGNHYIIFVFLAIKAGKSWYSSEQRKDELLLSSVETELEIYQYQLQPKLILSLVEQMEQLAHQHPEKAPEMIVKISGFLNRFLFEGKEDLISLQLDVNLLQEYLEIHRVALDDRLKLNFVVSGNLKPYVVPPLLLLPFLYESLKIVYACNNSFEISVLIKTERNYLLISFSVWSDNDFRINDDNDLEITRKRLNYRFRGKHRLIENIDENFREISLEIYE